MKRMRIPSLFLVLFALVALLTACGGDDTGSESSQGGTTNGAKLAATTLNASGATFPQAYYEQVIASFSEKHEGVVINYGGGGSGKGRTDLQTGVVDWAGSDGLVKPEDASKYRGPFMYFPTIAAPITVSYNVTGVDSLQLSPDTIAKIFQREVKTWNDKAIAADNPGAKLPSTPIVVAHRSDGSGTTENFTKFLKAASPAVWKLDSGSTVNWPTDTQAGNGNSGVAQIVKGTNGAIGYIDFADAEETGLKWAKVKNKAGKFVDASLEGTSSALAGITIKDDLTYNPLWADGEDSYPISAPTWILAYKDQTDKAKGEALKAFLQYIYGDGQNLAAEVNYAKLPDSLKEKALAQVNALVIPG
jgi:phosphate transport system substrate-binding protein